MSYITRLHSKSSPRKGYFSRLFIQAFSLACCFFLFTSCTKKTDSKDTTIHAVLSSNVKSLDPIFSDDSYMNAVNSQIFESLYHYHYLKRPLTLEPQLAEAMPQISKDGLTYTIKIKKGVLFQDNPAFPKGKGRELTAEDFVYSWKRLADPASRSSGFWIFDDRIVGLNQWRSLKEKDKADFSTPIEGLKAVDKHTIQIKLLRPYYQLVYVLAMNYSAPVAKEAVTKYGKELLNHPVGTGPFQFKEWIRNSKIVLVKNPTWRGETYPTEGEPTDPAKGYLKDAGKALPFVERIVFHEITEDQPRWLTLMKGDLDFSGIPKDNFDSAVQGDDLTKTLKGKGLHLDIAAEPDLTYTAFNMLDPLFKKNVKLRQAMSLAVDTKTLIKKFYNGRAIEAQSVIPPGIDAYDPAYKNPFRSFDLEKAKALLVEAGFPEGKGLPEIELATTSSSTARQMGEFFKQNMAQIGIKIKISTSSWPQFTSKIRNKKAQVWGIAWLADYPDAENFLQLLYGPNQSPGSNGANYTNPKFDKLYKEAALLPPGKKRTQLYHQMRDIVSKDTPWILGSHRLGYYISHSWLGNFKRHTNISDYYKYLRIDSKSRAQLKAKL